MAMVGDDAGLAVWRMLVVTEALESFSFGLDLKPFRWPLFAEQGWTVFALDQAGR